MSNLVIIIEVVVLYIKDMMKEYEEENVFLCVGVKGGGCSGFFYGMGFEYEKGELDSMFDQYGIIVFVDKESFDIMNGIVIDYK